MDESLISFLSGVEPFLQMKAPAIAEIARSMERLEFPAGAGILQENDSGDFAYLIQQGAASITRSGVELFVRGPGDWIGEIPMIDGGARSSTVTASTDMVLLKITRKDFMAWMSQDNGMVMGLARMLAGKLRSDTQVQQEKNTKLKTLMDASKLINSSIETDELIASILTVARRELNVERGTVYFVDHAKGILWAKIASGPDVGQIQLPIGQGLAGTVAATGETIVLNDAYADPRFDRATDIRSGFHTRSVLSVPIKNQAGRVVGVLQLLNKKDGEFNEQDLGFLQALSDYVAIAMENAMLHLSLVEKERMQKELQLAREIQRHLLPAPPGNIPFTVLKARSLPCYEVGGDYYEFLPLADGTLVIAIGDVSGKGVAAALVMSSLQAALRMAAPLENNLPVLVGHLNALIHGMTNGLKYVTFFLSRYDPSTGLLRYVNAGHQPALVLSSSGVQQLDATGMPIGLIPGRTWREEKVTIEPGGLMLLFTDGLTEAVRPDVPEFGIPRLKDLALELWSRGEDELIQGLLDAVTAYESGNPVADDKTVVLLGRLPTSASQ